MKSFLAVALSTTVLLAACNRESTSAPSAIARQAQALTIKTWPLPVNAAAAQPDLVATPDGHLLLSWIEPQAQGHVLKFAAFENAQWGAPQQIASGKDWFVNWADTPHVSATADGALWAHWLQKSAAATYAYDVALVRSSDGGRTWSAPVLVNNDGKATEHGFVSMWAASRDSLGVAWLDGRESGGAEHAMHEGADTHGSSGMMTLRAATFDAQLLRRDDTRVDATTCDCCQTDATLTARGPLLVFRDRTAEEIRDIAVSRLQGGAWTPPHIVHADGWKMPACPVNGPAIAAQGSEVVIGWYTAANEVPTLKLARSSDAGDRFGAPVVVDQGEAVQGRVDVALDGEAAWMLWLREDTRGQSLQLARYARDLLHPPQRIEVAQLQGRGRGTGFPQFVVRNGTAHVVWTDVVGGKPQLHAATVMR